MVDVLLVSLGSTFGLRAADDELAASLRRAGASVEVVVAARPREVRTFMATDLLWALAARRAAAHGLRRWSPRAVLYATTTSALLWPRPGAIRFDALAAETRPGRHGLWQRPLERRRLRSATLLVPQVAHGLTGEVVVPIPVERSGPADGPRDIAAITYAANPSKKGLDRVVAAWSRVRRDDEELWVCGTDHLPSGVPGVVAAGSLPPDEYRALLRRARVYVTAPRREDYGVAQLEALADGCVLVTNAAPGPYAALPLARALDPALVAPDDDLGPALRRALDDVDTRDYAARAASLLHPFTRAAVDAQVREVLLPHLL